MTKIEIREYLPEDYLKVNRRHFDSLTIMHFPNPKLVAINLGKGPAFTALADGEIIACGGIIPLWKGVGEGWTITSKLVSLYPTTFAKIVWRKFKSVIEELDLERVQTTVDAEHKVSQGWVEWMGFKNEGLMRKYLDGRDYFRYSWVKE